METHCVLQAWALAGDLRAFENWAGQTSEHGADFHSGLYRVSAAAATSQCSQAVPQSGVDFSAVIFSILCWPYCHLVFSHIPGTAAPQETKVQGRFMGLKTII